MAEAQEKGDALEAAVRTIEQLILSLSPSYNERSFRIESKQRVRMAGVTHEIDLLVRVLLAPGYEAIFIFECKNWERNVGKNEIIVLSEKIDALQAQKGFFVARSFTRDAVAQAAKDPRLVLLNATDHGPNEQLRPFGFHSIHLDGRPNAQLVLRRFDLPPDTPPTQIDHGAVVVLNGEPIPLGAYITEWTMQAIDERLRSFPSHELPEDVYDLSAEQKREFARGTLIFDGKELETLELSVRFRERVIRPPILSNFDVHGRGRVITFAPISYGDAEVQFGIVATPLRPGDEIPPQPP